MKKQLMLWAILILLIVPLHATPGHVSSVTFLHFRFKDTTDNEFALKRAYLTYANGVNDALSYKLQLDVGSGGASAYSVYLKTASVDWKTKLGNFTLGIQGMNMFKIQENTWGYRFIEKSAMDLGGFSSSADLGARWVNTVGPASVNLMITNGNGYKKAESDGHKKISARLHVGQEKLTEGFNAGIVTSHEGVDYDVSSTGSSLVMGGFGGWVLGPLTVGAEYSMKTVKTSTELNSTVISAYGRTKINNQTELFVRSDYIDPDMDTEKDAELFIVSGANYKLDKSLYIAPNFRIQKPESGDPQLEYYINFQFKY